MSESPKKEQEKTFVIEFLSAGLIGLFITLHAMKLLGNPFATGIPLVGLTNLALLAIWMQLFSIARNYLKPR